MSTDDDIRAALQTVADDTTHRSDEASWAAIRADAASSSKSSDNRWLRPILLAVASVTVIAAVVGVALQGDDGTARVDTLHPDPTAAETHPPDTSPTSTVPEALGEAERDIVVGPGQRPMVVVSDNGRRVTAYFSDGQDPIVYEGITAQHAEMAPDGTLWITPADPDGCVTCGVTGDKRLIHVDPETGAELGHINSAGYFATSPDGELNAYIHYADDGTSHVVITSFEDADHPDFVNYSIPAHDGSPESALWSLGQISWSPDGNRLLVHEFWEDDSMWLIDIDEDDYVADGIHLSLRGADWLTDERLLATSYCCYAEPDQDPRHLVEVDLTGAEPLIISRAEAAGGVLGVIPDGLDRAVYTIDSLEYSVNDDGPDMTVDGGTLVRIATGDVIAEDVVSVQW